MCLFGTALSSVSHLDLGDGVRVPFASLVRYPGVKTLSMSDHVASVCRSSYIYLRMIARVTPVALWLSLHSLVLSHVEYAAAVFLVYPKEPSKVGSCQQSCSQTVRLCQAT